MDEPKKVVDGGSTQRTTTITGPTIDIEKLTEKVYELMCKEMRLTRARGNKSSARR